MTERLAHVSPTTSNLKFEPLQNDQGVAPWGRAALFTVKHMAPVSLQSIPVKSCFYNPYFITWMFSHGYCCLLAMESVVGCCMPPWARDEKFDEGTLVSRPYLELTQRISHTAFHQDLYSSRITKNMFTVKIKPFYIQTPHHLHCIPTAAWINKRIKLLKL